MYKTYTDKLTSNLLLVDSHPLNRNLATEKKNDNT